MSGNLTPIDISNMPDLVRIVEDLKTSRQPRILQQDGQPVATLTPTHPLGKRESYPQKRNIWTHYNPQRVRAALQISAGALQGINREELLSELAAQRSQQSSGRQF